MPDHNVIVIGGSLGGLTAALTLRDVGCAVTIYERASAPLVGQGAGIVLHPLTVRYLVERAGLDLDAISTTTSWTRYIADDGSVAHEQPCAYRLSSYNTLYQGLLAQLDLRHYRLGSAITGFVEGADGVEVRCADGTTDRCDLLVAADGIRSTARRLLLPNLAPSYTGYIAWRGTIDPLNLTLNTVGLLHDAICYHLMPQSHLLTYPIPGEAGAGAQINWLWYRNVAPGPELDDLLTDRGGVRRDLSVSAGNVPDRHVARLRADAGQLPTALAELVRHTRRPFIQAVVDLEPPQMAFGRAALIGDAAFVARPHVAAGTAKAAADAWALAEAVAALPDLPAALARWQQGQLRLGRSVLRRARAAGDSLQRAGAWRVGDPLPFGLFQEGDSVMES